MTQATIVLALLLGLLLILGGMQLLRQGLQTLAASRLRRALLWMTGTPWRGFWSGTAATALLQSSTALTVMAVSFVDAGLLPFTNTLALILGSNIGTTVTTQLLAFPLHGFALAAMLSGSLGCLFTRSRWRHLALAVLGLGLLFFGLELLQAALAPLAGLRALQDFLRRLGDHHFRGILAGAALAALLHSSSATTGIVMLLTEEGWLTLPTALAFVFGANIGTCFTAVIASLAASRAAQRTALFHVLLNVFGVVLFYPLLVPLSAGIAWLGGSLARQVANAHTFFNVASSLLAYPLLPWAAKLLGKLR